MGLFYLITSQREAGLILWVPYPKHKQIHMLPVCRAEGPNSFPSSMLLQKPPIPRCWSWWGFRRLLSSTLSANPCRLPKGSREGPGVSFKIGEFQAVASSFPLVSLLSLPKGLSLKCGTPSFCGSDSTYLDRKAPNCPIESSKGECLKFGKYPESSEPLSQPRPLQESRAWPTPNLLAQGTPNVNPGKTLVN